MPKSLGLKAAERDPNWRSKCHAQRHKTLELRIAEKAVRDPDTEEVEVGRSMNYEQAYKALHEKGKYFPGYSICTYVDSIAALVKEHQSHRLLDVGSGRGLQYLKRRVHERWGGILPYCYDVGVRGLDERPEGRFGGVINTDMLEHIERPDLPEILDDLLGYVEPGGFLFLGISCRPTRKKLPGGGDVHRTIERPQWWVELIKSRLQGWPVHVRAEFDLGDPPHFADAALGPWEHHP